MINMREMEKKFREYIYSKLFCTSEQRRFINLLLSSGDAYIFGGVIRDFFLEESDTLEHRDIDIVVKQFDSKLDHYIKEVMVRKTRFGGYKLWVGEREIDIWELKKTWAIHHKPKFELMLDELLPATSFFNITAIVFSIAENEFIYKKKFEQGIKSRVLDIVYEPNPFPELCIVKTIEYVQRYGLRVSKGLRKYILRHFGRTNKKLISIQLSHYGVVKYNEGIIDQFIETIKLQDENKRAYRKRITDVQLQLDILGKSGIGEGGRRVTD